MYTIIMWVDVGVNATLVRLFDINIIMSGFNFLVVILGPRLHISSLHLQWNHCIPDSIRDTEQ